MKLSIKNGIIICLFSFIAEANIAQTYVEGLLWANIADSSAKSIGDTMSASAELNSVFVTYKTYSYKQAMSFAKTDALRNIYEIKCNCNTTDLRSELISEFPTLFSNVEQRPIPTLNYNPADGMWGITIGPPPITNDWLWDLLLIQADKAWDITKGDSNLKIALIDNQIDLAHPDLYGKVDPVTDFYTGSPLTVDPTMPDGGHGTSTSTILAGETVDQGQTPHGSMASIGYNCKIMFAEFGGGSAAALYASSVLGAKIISISWYSGCTPNANDLLIEQEILNNGTAIIRAAGNGSAQCSGGPMYPFSGVEDGRTIVVSSTDFNDNHYDYNPGDVATVSDYPAVDVCAPGYHLMGGVLTYGTTWPYWGGWGGTSQSTPIVAGLAGLMLSCNPTLNNVDIQAIIKQNVDPITDAANYPGTVGTGRINAYKAVTAACTPCTTDLTLSGAASANENDRVSNYITSTANVDNGITTSYKAGVLVDLQNGFQAVAGSSFHAYIGNCLYDGSGMRQAGQQHANNNLTASNNSHPIVSNTTSNTIKTKLGSNIKLGIYPNPTSGVVYLNLSAQNTGYLLVKISDLNGNQVLNNSFSVNQGTNSFKVDLGGINQGVYFINASDENGITIKNDKLILLPQ